MLGYHRTEQNLKVRYSTMLALYPTNYKSRMLTFWGLSNSVHKELTTHMLYIVIIIIISLPLYTAVEHAEVVHKDLKSTLRVLYSIFGKYKSHFQQQPHPQATPTTPAATASV